MMRIFFLISVGFTLLSAASAGAQDPLLAQLYGSGVHAFFAGNYQQADDDLTAAINGGSKDPRTYYFRALCDLRTGRSQAANDDFQHGADLESADVNQSFGVSKSLERVQGSQRSTLEKYRLRARIAAHQKKEDQRQLGYQKRRDADSLLVRQAVPPASAAAIQQKAAGATPADTENPFGEAPKTTLSDKPVEAKDAEPAAGDANNPFGVGEPAAKGGPPGEMPPPDAGPPVASPPENSPPASGGTPPPTTPTTPKPATPPSSGDPFGPEGPPK